MLSSLDKIQTKSEQNLITFSSVAFQIGSCHYFLGIIKPFIESPEGEWERGL